MIAAEPAPSAEPVDKLPIVKAVRAAGLMKEALVLLEEAGAAEAEASLRRAIITLGAH